MWANLDLVELLTWMRRRNQIVPRERPIAFYGLDVYSLFESVAATLKQLERISPVLARRVRLRYACFDPFLGDERAYAKSLVELPEGCEAEVTENLRDLLHLRLDGLRDREAALFDAIQNARVVADAERYYRAMVHGGEDSWNVRDEHMVRTLDALLDHHGKDSKGIVWAHNTHIGDYRATEMRHRGQVNIGGLARERWGEEKIALVGFGTYQGQVTAAHAWDGPALSLTVPPGRPGTVEAAMHDVSRKLGEGAFRLSLRDNVARNGALAETLGHRAIGVVYHPEYERFGNYVPTELANRYDAFIFIDETTALSPLSQRFERRDIPETWPRGE
jgi:erythromycin esterase-like protein